MLTVLALLTLLKSKKISFLTFVVKWYSSSGLVTGHDLPVQWPKKFSFILECGGMLSC